MAATCETANGTGSLVFIDDVTTDRSRRMNLEVYRASLTTQVHSNAAKLTRQMDNDPKHTVTATQELHKAKY